VRTLLCLTLVVAACAREKPQAAMSAADRYAGDWEGRSVQSATDTGLAFAGHLTAGPEGTVSGTIVFAGLESAAIALRTVEVSDSTIVFEIGPYQVPGTNTEAITRFEGRLAGDSLWGSYVTLPTVGGGVVPDMSTAQWKNAETHPAPGSEPMRGTFAVGRKRAAP
jgi:hypothetical protein